MKQAKKKEIGMRAEQAIYTSLARQGMAGYHVVARSPGVADREAAALATWSPSHGSLRSDAANRTSLNFHPLPSGRYALSRSCEGLPEYSGRGRRQVYTHALILDAEVLAACSWQAVALYRDALALGRLIYQADPPGLLEPVELSLLHGDREGRPWAERARRLGVAEPEVVAERLAGGAAVRLACGEDRIALAECLLNLLPARALPEVSFSTSLLPSAVRPYRLILLDAAS